MKKIFLVVLMLMVVFTMAACGGESSGGQSGDAPTAEVAFPQEVFITMNGTEVRVGDNFANVEGKIGEEVRPSETLEPCDPNFETATVEHYYDGVHITTNEEGIIATISLDIRDGETDSAFAGKVKLGDPTDSIKEVLGDPADEDDMFISYYFGDEEDCNMLVYKDEAGNGTLDGLVFSCGRLTMVEQG